MDWELITACAIIVVPVLIYCTVKRMRRAKWDRWMAKLIADAKAGKLPETSLEDAKNGVISLSKNGFAVHRGAKCLTDVKWDAVNEIRAYKADLFSTDLICWSFLCSGRDYLVEVNEEMVGFEKLQEAVKAHYGITLEDWWSEVAFPAFATNMTVIWPKKEDTQPCHPADADDRAVDG